MVRDNAPPEERRHNVLGPVDVGDYTPGIQRMETYIRDILSDHDRVCELKEDPLWYKDYSLLNHSEQVAIVMSAIGNARGRDEKNIHLGRVSGLFHDIGKIEKSCHIYRLNRVLSEEEKREIDKHSAISGDIILELMARVRPVDRAFLAEVHIVVRHHHDPGKVSDPYLREKCFDLNRADIFVSLMETRHRIGLSQFQAAIALEEITLKDQTSPRFSAYHLEMQASMQTIVRLYGEKSILI